MIPWHLGLLCPQEQWGHLSCLARPLAETALSPSWASKRTGDIYSNPYQVDSSSLSQLIHLPTSFSRPFITSAMTNGEEKSSKWMLLVIRSSLPAKVLMTTWTSKGLSFTLIHTQFNVSTISLWGLGDLFFKTNSAILCNAFLQSLIISACKGFLWVLAVRSN